MALGRRSELYSLAARTRRGADGVVDDLDDGLARAQVGVEEVSLDLLGKEAPEPVEALVGDGGRGDMLMADGVGGTPRELLGVELRLLRDAAPFGGEEDEGRECVGIGDLEDPR